MFIGGFNKESWTANEGIIGITRGFIRICLFIGGFDKGSWTANMKGNRDNWKLNNDNQGKVGKYPY